MNIRNGLIIHGNPKVAKKASIRKNTADMKPAKESGWPANTSAPIAQNVALAAQNIYTTLRMIRLIGEMI